MIFNKKMLIIVLPLVLFVGVGYFKYSEKYDGTPFVVGSGEYVGYDAARVNGFKNVGECTADPEFSALSGYVVGCERFFK